MKLIFLKNIDNITGNLNNNFSIKLDKTNKLIKYNYDVSGNIEKSKFTFFKPFKSNLFEEKIEKNRLFKFRTQSIFFAK